MSQSIRFENDATIVDFSRTVVGEGERPHRIVLRDDGKQFITHREILYVLIDVDAKGLPSRLIFTHESFENGNYFRYGHGTDREEAKTQAFKDFERRSLAHGR